MPITPQKDNDTPKNPIPNSNPLNNPSKAPVEFPASPDENPLPREVEFNERERQNDEEGDIEAHPDVNSDRNPRSKKSVEQAPAPGEEQAP